MIILNRNSIKDNMVEDLEQIIVCINNDVSLFCNTYNWDIYDFISELDEN